MTVTPSPLRGTSASQSLEARFEQIIVIPFAVRELQTIQEMRN